MTTTAQPTKTSISSDGRSATVSIPVSFLQRGDRKQILSPPGTVVTGSAHRQRILKAIVTVGRLVLILNKLPRVHRSLARRLPRHDL